MERDISASLPGQQNAILEGTQIIIETAPDGTGTEVEAVTFTSGDAPVTYYAVVRNSQGFFVSNSEPVTWSLSGAIGMISSTATSVTFTPQGSGTGTIYADHSYLLDDITGQLEVLSGAGNRISIETAADGTGIEVDTHLVIRGGSAQTFYAVVRDQFNNYVGNNESVDWSFSNPALVTLTPSPSTSVTVQGTIFGTGILTATSATFADDSTGIVTIGVGPAYALSIEDAVSGGGTAPVVFDLTQGGLDGRLYAIVRDEGGNFVNNTTSVTWSVQNSAIASLNTTSGTSVAITPLLAGSTRLTATSSGLVTDDVESIRVNHGEQQLSVGGNFSCVLRTNNEVKCWGNNGGGQLGLGDSTHRGGNIGDMGASLPALDLTPAGQISKIDLGINFGCALFSDGALKCWGVNGNGQLGTEDLNNRGDDPVEMGSNLREINLGPGRSVKDFSAGGFSVCAILDNDQLKCWGLNDAGQLGLEDLVDRGGTILSMGVNLPYVNLGTGRTVKKVSVGDDFACAILDNDDLKCWGDNTNGCLGLGDIVSRGGTPGDMGDNLPVVDLGTRVPVDVRAGSNHTCVLLQDLNLLCFGRNVEGQLGLGHNFNRGDDPLEVGNNYEIMKVGAGRTIVSFSAGQESTCVVLDNNDTKCFGNNNVGQLGQENTANLGDDSGEVHDLVLPINLGTEIGGRTVGVGQQYTCVLTNDNRAKCFGFNTDGRLGQESVLPLGDDPGETGDNLNFIRFY